MLGEIGRVENIPKYIAKAKDKNDPFRLMGFGHRVYKNYDPRAKIMQSTTHEVLNELGVKDDPLLRSRSSSSASRCTWYFTRSSGRILSASSSNDSTIYAASRRAPVAQSPSKR